MTVVQDETVASEPPRARGGVLGVFRDPARTFLVLAIALGVYFVCVVPHFGGIDEPAHFYRAYQISTGQFVPEPVPGSEFSGACVPVDVILGLQASSGMVFVHNLELQGEHPKREPEPTVRGLPRCEGDSSKRMVSFSTFGSPIPYLPQAAAMLVGRGVGADVDGMVFATRLTTLAVFIAVVWAAIRRSTRAKWALGAVGLLPVALFQSSVSASHDALTVAVTLLVISSALRTVDLPPTTARTGVLMEAAVLTALLAACKPGYVVVALCYLLPLLGPRRRRDLWPLAFAPVLGAVVSIAWNRVVGDLWKTDAAFFGVRARPNRQRDQLLTEPWTFGEAALRTAWEEGWHWSKQLFTLGPSVSVWPTLAVVAALLVFAAVSVQRAPREPSGLHWSQRALFAAVFVLGALLVLGAQYVTWSDLGADEISGMQARFFVPLLACLPIAVGPAGWRWATSQAARIPVAVAIVPVYVALAVTIAFRMY